MLLVSKLHFEWERSPYMRTLKLIIYVPITFAMILKIHFEIFKEKSSGNFGTYEDRSFSRSNKNIWTVVVIGITSCWVFICLALAENCNHNSNLYSFFLFFTTTEWRKYHLPVHEASMRQIFVIQAHSNSTLILKPLLKSIFKGNQYKVDRSTRS